MSVQPLPAPSLFRDVPAAPPDPILGLSEAFRADPHPHKINLSVGVYQDAQGKTAKLASVREAEQRLAAAESGADYLPILGLSDFVRDTRALAFGSASPALTEGRIVSAQTPAGTGALRVAAEFISTNLGPRTVWLSDPTWPNHPAIFGAAGLPTKAYPYFDPSSNGLAIDRLLDGLQTIPAGDVVVFHGNCHNPTGVDPTPEQWDAILRLCQDRGLMVLIDFAYQGFGDGLEEDAVGVRQAARLGVPLLVCASFSKNFGLYQQRVGALHVVTASAEEADRVASQVKVRIRTNYSNPPAHGARVVSTILADPTLRRQWETELAAMRGRIHEMRRALVEGLRSAGAPRDFSFLIDQRGMFSFSGLTKDQVQRLRTDFSIYIVASGRINVAGLTADNLPRVCEAIAKVLLSR